MIPILLDENIPPAVRQELLRRDPEIRIWRVGDPGAPALGTGDPEILRWCEQHGYVLFTVNRHTMPAHLHEHLAAGRHVPGILVPRGSMTFGQVLDSLELFAVVGRPEDLVDQIVHLPL